MRTIVALVVSLCVGLCRAEPPVYSPPVAYAPPAPAPPPPTYAPPVHYVPAPYAPPVHYEGPAPYAPPVHYAPPHDGELLKPVERAPEPAPAPPPVHLPTHYQPAPAPLPAPAPRPYAPAAHHPEGSLQLPEGGRVLLTDKHGQYSQGYNDKGTKVSEQGRLISTNDGWEAVIVKEGSYSYVSPEGIPIKVNYIADENGFRVLGQSFSR